MRIAWQVLLAVGFESMSEKFHVFKDFYAATLQVVHEDHLHFGKSVHPLPCEVCCEHFFHLKYMNSTGPANLPPLEQKHKIGSDLKLSQTIEPSSSALSALTGSRISEKGLWPTLKILGTEPGTAVDEAALYRHHMETCSVMDLLQMTTRGNTRCPGPVNF